MPQLPTRPVAVSDIQSLAHDAQMFGRYCALALAERGCARRARNPETAALHIDLARYWAGCARSRYAALCAAVPDINAEMRP